MIWIFVWYYGIFVLPDMMESSKMAKKIFEKPGWHLKWIKEIFIWDI